MLYSFFIEKKKKDFDHLLCIRYCAQCWECNREQGRHSSGLYGTCRIVGKKDFEHVIINEMSLTKGKVRGDGPLPGEARTSEGAGRS